MQRVMQDKGTSIQKTGISGRDYKKPFTQLKIF